MGSQSTTTKTEAPSYAKPYIKYGLDQTANQYYQDQETLDPFNHYQTTALLGTANLAQNNQLSNNAANLANQTLSGGFLGSNPYLSSYDQFSGGSNPYLDATFNKAALATQNQLASQFAGAGRNIGASEGLRSQQLNDLATNIYGGAYENDRNRALAATNAQAGLYEGERDRQQQTLGQSPLLSQAQYGDLDRLLGVGQSSGVALDQYMNRVGSGSYGNTVTQSGGGNNWAAGLGMLGLYLSDKRMKTDIEKVGESAGLNVYDFRYKGDKTKTPHRGFMAQEVEKKYPDAVVDIGGVKHVNYGFLGSVM